MLETGAAMSASRGFAWFDDSHWPLLINRLVGEASNQEFDAYLAQSTRFMARGQPHVFVVDMSGVGSMPPEQRQRLAEWSRQHDALMQRTVLGAAYIVSSSVVRLALSVVLHLRRPSYPYVIVSREDQALEWAVKRLEDVGMHAPAGRIRHELGLVPEHRAG